LVCCGFAAGVCRELGALVLVIVVLIVVIVGLVVVMGTVVWGISVGVFFFFLGGEFSFLFFGEIFWF
jgi:hypothetical protein